MPEDTHNEKGAKPDVWFHLCRRANVGKCVRVRDEIGGALVPTPLTPSPFRASKYHMPSFPFFRLSCLKGWPGGDLGFSCGCTASGHRQPAALP